MLLGLQTELSKMEMPQEEWEIDPSTLADGVGLHGISLTAQGDANG